MATIAKKCSVCGALYRAYNYVDIPVSRDDDNDDQEYDDDEAIDVEVEEDFEPINFEPNGFEFVTIKEDMDIQYDFDNNDLCPECMTIFENFVTGKIPSATGNPVVLEDAAPGKPIETVVDILPVQEGSGDPSPENVRPITGFNELNVTGKNLLKYPYTQTTRTTNGITFTDNGDGTITANGTATANAYFYFWNRNTSKFYLKQGQYKLSDYKVFGDSFTGVGVNYTNESSAEVGVAFTSVNREATFEVNQYMAENGIGCYIRVKKNAVLDNFVFKPMIRYASVDDSLYEPYQKNTYAVSDDQTVYGGTLNAITGELTVTRVLRKITSVTRNNDHSFYSSTSGESLAEASQYTNEIFCDRLPTANVTPSGAVNAIFVNASKAIRYQTEASYASAAEFLEAMGGELNVCYKLDAPQTIQLDPLGLRLLKGSNTIETDAGTITIKYKKAIEGKMEVES